MTRKWGSCSTAGWVTFARDLLGTSSAFQDYVIVHELLHLKVSNHGRLFKSYLTAYLPDWKRSARLFPVRNLPCFTDVLRRTRKDADSRLPPTENLLTNPHQPKSRLPESHSMCRLQFFRRLPLEPFDKRRKHINWDRQNGRGVMLARNLLHCL